MSECLSHVNYITWLVLNKTVGSFGLRASGANKRMQFSIWITQQSILLLKQQNYSNGMLASAQFGLVCVFAVVFSRKCYAVRWSGGSGSVIGRLFFFFFFLSFFLSLFFLSFFVFSFFLFSSLSFLSFFLSFCFVCLFVCVFTHMSNIYGSM